MMVIHTPDGEIDAVLLHGARYTPAELAALIVEREALRKQVAALERDVAALRAAVEGDAP